MKDILEKIKDFKLFKDMPIDDYKIAQSYNHGFFKNRINPRFFQSYLYLKSERKYFYYGFIDDNFILIKKKKEFGNRVCYLVIPPINKNGDLTKEFNLIEEFRKAGIKCKLSDEDISLYDLSKKSLSKEKDNIEMIYSLENYKKYSSYDMSNFRYSENRFKKLIKDGPLSCSIKTSMSSEDCDDNNELLKSWSLTKRKNGIKSDGDHCHLWFNDLISTDTAPKYYSIHNMNKLYISSIVEEVAPNKFILDTNYLDYNFNIKGFDAIKANHMWVLKTLPDGALLNSGSGGWDKGLTIHKRLLKPCTELQIYDTKIVDKLTEEEYQSICLG